MFNMTSHCWFVFIMAPTSTLIDIIPTHLEELTNLHHSLSLPLSLSLSVTQLNMFGAMHFIYQINRLTTTKVDSTYLG